MSVLWIAERRGVFRAPANAGQLRFSELGYANEAEKLVWSVMDDGATMRFSQNFTSGQCAVVLSDPKKYLLESGIIYRVSITRS